MSNVETLARDWLKAKHDENAARKSRLNIEGQLIEALGAKEEGAQTHEIGDYKVTLTGKLTRSMDADLWLELRADIPESLWPVNAKVVYSPDKAGMAYLQENETKAWRKIADAFTTKPAKTSIMVKET